MWSCGICGMALHFKTLLTMPTKQQVDETVERLKHDITSKDVGLGVYADIQTLLSSHEERGRVLEWLEKANKAQYDMPVELEMGSDGHSKIFVNTNLICSGPTLTAAVLAAIEKEK